MTTEFGKIGNFENLLVRGNDFGLDQKPVPEQLKDPQVDAAKDKLSPPVVLSDPMQDRIVSDAIVKNENVQKTITEDKFVQDTEALLSKEESARIFNLLYAKDKQAPADLDAFVTKCITDFNAALEGSNLAGESKTLAMNVDDAQCRKQVKLIALQLLSSKSIGWMLADKKDDVNARNVEAAEKAFGFEVTASKVELAMKTLMALVRRGQLSIRSVMAYVDETVTDFRDMKSSLRLSMRAIGALRAKLIEADWGDNFKKVAKVVAELKRTNQFTDGCKEAYTNLLKVVNEWRTFRYNSLCDQGLHFMPPNNTGTLSDWLSTTRDELARFHAKPGVRVFSQRQDSLCKEKYNNCLDVFIAELDNAHQQVFANQGNVLPEENDLQQLRNEVGLCAKEISDHLKLTLRLEREQQIRDAFKEALGRIPQGANGLCQSGIYEVAFSVGVGASGKLLKATENTTGVELKGSLQYTFKVTVAITEGGMASVSHKHSVSLGASVGIDAPIISASAGLSGEYGFTNASNYPNLDSLCNDTSRVLLTMITGRGWSLSNLFSGGSANKVSRELAFQLDNYSFKSHLLDIGLWEETDRFLMPPMNQQIVGTTKTHQLQGDAKADFKARKGDPVSNWDKSGVSTSFGVRASRKWTTKTNYLTHFEAVRKQKIFVDVPSLVLKFCDRLGETNLADIRGNNGSMASFLDKCKQAEQEIKSGNAELPKDTKEWINEIKTKVSGRIKALREELDEFIKAAFDSTHGHGKTKYLEMLNSRHIQREGKNFFRNLIPGVRKNIRRTLFLADLAKEAASCEALLNELSRPNEQLDIETQNNLKVIERKIYEQPEIRIQNDVAMESLYFNESTTSGMRQQTVVFDAKCDLKGYLGDVGRGYSPGLKVAVTHTHVLPPKDPIAASKPKSPWNADHSMSLAVTFTDTTMVSEIVDTIIAVIKKTQEHGVADVAADLSDNVLRMVLQEYLENNEELKSFKAGGTFVDIQHAYTLNVNMDFVKSGPRLREISLSRMHSQRIAAQYTTSGSVAFSVNGSLSRSNIVTLGYRVGSNTLAGFMSHFVQLQHSPYKVRCFLQKNKWSVKSLFERICQQGFVDYVKDKPSEHLYRKSGLADELREVRYKLSSKVKELESKLAKLEEENREKFEENAKDPGLAVIKQSIAAVQQDKDAAQRLLTEFDDSLDDIVKLGTQKLTDENYVLNPYRVQCADLEQILTIASNLYK